MKYKVYYETTIEGCVEVDAESEEDARDEAVYQIMEELEASGYKYHEIETFV